MYRISIKFTSDSNDRNNSTKLEDINLNSMDPISVLIRQCDTKGGLCDIEVVSWPPGRTVLVLLGNTTPKSVKVTGTPSRSLLSVPWAMVSAGFCTTTLPRCHNAGTYGE